MTLVIVGIFQMFFLASTATMLQMIVPDELRGRVLSLYMLDRGFMPLGALFAGTSAHFIGAPTDSRDHGRHRHRAHRAGRLAHPGDPTIRILEP